MTSLIKICSTVLPNKNGSKFLDKNCPRKHVTVQLLFYPSYYLVGCAAPELRRRKIRKITSTHITPRAHPCRLTQVIFHEQPHGSWGAHATSLTYSPVPPPLPLCGSVCAHVTLRLVLTRRNFLPRRTQETAIFFCPSPHPSQKPSTCDWDLKKAGTAKRY